MKRREFFTLYNERRLAWNEESGMRERTAPCDQPKGKLSFNP